MRDVVLYAVLVCTDPERLQAIGTRMATRDFVVAVPSDRRELEDVLGGVRVPEVVVVDAEAAVPEAVETVEGYADRVGPVLLLTGPGTGPTRLEPRRVRLVDAPPAEVARLAYRMAYAEYRRCVEEPSWDGALVPFGRGDAGG